MADLTHLVHLLPALDRLIEAASPEDKDQAVRPLEDRLRRAVFNMWRDQKRRVLERLPKYRHRFSEALGDDELDILWNAVTSATQGPMADTIDEVAPTALERGYSAAASDIAASSSAARTGLSFDLRNPRAVQYLRDHSGLDTIRDVDRTTREAIRRILTVATDNGWSYSRTEREIRSRFAQFGARVTRPRHIRTRSELIAVTEIGRAYEHGHQMVMSELREQGIQTEKQWLTAGDERVCPVCLPAGGQGWIPSTEQFTNGLDGPLGHAGCRCAVQTRVAEESRVPTPAAA